MSYYDKVARPGEMLLLRGKLHWFVYVPGITLATIGVVALCFAAVLRASDDDASASASALVAMLSLMILGLSILVFLSIGLRRVTTEIIVTDKRVIFKTGFISRRTAEMNTSKIETVDVIQGISGRILGFGTVLIRGTGSTFEPLSQIADPLSIRNSILVG